MTTPSRQKLAARYGALLKSPPGPRRRRETHALGAQAAREHHDIDELVSAIIAALAHAWADRAPVHDLSPEVVHGDAAQLLATAGDILDAARLHPTHPSRR